MSLSPAYPATFKTHAALAASSLVRGKGQITPFEDVPVATGCLSRMPSAWTLAPQDILAVSDRLQVLGIYASGHAAQMIEVEAVRDCASIELKCDAVCGSRDLTECTEASIACASGSSSPNPTGAGDVLIHLLLESPAHIRRLALRTNTAVPRRDMRASKAALPERAPLAFGSPFGGEAAAFTEPAAVGWAQFGGALAAGFHASILHDHEPPDPEAPQLMLRLGESL